MGLFSRKKRTENESADVVRKAMVIAEDQDIMAEIKRGNTVEAIKRVKEKYGMSIREAKEYVDRVSKK